MFKRVYPGILTAKLSVSGVGMGFLVFPDFSSWFIFISDALHITPVKGIIQLRPGFSYFDKAEENQKKAAAALIDAEKGLLYFV